MLFLLAPAPEPVTLTPSDDLWVYPHSSDPAHDETMRIWGAGGRSVALDAGDAEDFAYGYLRFTIPASYKGAKLVGATLELTNVPNDALKPDELAATPLEVRPLIGRADEKSWTYTDVAKVFPDPKTLWGKGVPTLADGTTPIFRIDLPLTAGEGFGPSPFAKAFESAIPATGDGELNLALTSGMDVAENGMSKIYKIYTKEASDPIRRPRLVLRFGESG